MNKACDNSQESLFDRNFKIPKRKIDNNCSDRNSPILHKIFEDPSNQHNSNMERYSPGSSTPSFQQPTNFQGIQPPLSDYDNLPQLAYDATKDYSAPFQTIQAAFRSNHELPLLNQPPVYAYNVNPLKRHREVPKNNNHGLKYANTFPHLGDPTLPKELTEQFQPLYCKLCAAKLSSNSMAKLHYKSKNHEKKVRKFLLDYSERTGEPLHERAHSVVTKKPKLKEGNNPKCFHCDVCDLPLTGRQHAESHYMGKNHQKAMAGKTPAGKGHFNEEGKWVRRTNLVTWSAGSDNFGVDFRTPTELAAVRDSRIKILHCEICDVTVTSEQQMTLHVSGQKHKKRLQHQISNMTNENMEDSILSALSSLTVPNGDLSVYRTPTGYYYCNPCNLSLNSEIQFKQHLGSKKHRKKASCSKE